jgi:hypothetical protein
VLEACRVTTIRLRELRQRHGPGRRPDQMRDA